MRHALVRTQLLTLITAITMGSHVLAQPTASVTGNPPFGRNEVRIIAVPGAPLEIVSYEAEYRDRGTYTTEGIHHSVTVRNVSEQVVVAIGIGFNAFDVFKRYMGRPLNGIDIDPIVIGETTGRMTWTQTPPASFTFYRYGIGVAYVRVARLADGTIWHADMDYVLDQLRQIEDGLTLEDLAEER